ncbi:unnamed protein product [Rotaria magnacalcarata]
MIAFIRQNPNVAFDIHEHLTHHTHPHRINAPAQSSTPQTSKRILDSSDNDGAQISKQQRVLSNGKQKKTREMNFSKVPSPVHQMNNNLRLDQPRQQASVQQQHRVPFEQLKRAVSSNLPSARVIEGYFKQQGIAISFSLVGHAGNKFKLGVNNKESYATLINTGKWPSQINNINITVSKPKFIPDSFVLVVRYVPLQYDDEFVKEEIKRNLQSVENIRHIQYRTRDKRNGEQVTRQEETYAALRTAKSIKQISLARYYPLNPIDSEPTFRPFAPKQIIDICRYAFRNRLHNFDNVCSLLLLICINKLIIDYHHIFSRTTTVTNTSDRLFHRNHGAWSHLTHPQNENFTSGRDVGHCSVLFVA